VSIDGKTVRGSKQSGLKSAIYLVSTFSKENEVFLGQIKTEEKSNEITEIPELLKILDLEKVIHSPEAGTELFSMLDLNAKIGAFMLGFGFE
jgi:hypothetical protein